METSSLYGLASAAISDFYWSDYSPWMAVALAAALWAAIIAGYRHLNRSSEKVDVAPDDQGKHTIVAVPAHESLAFPGSCVSCGDPTVDGCHMTVSAGIGAGTAHRLSVGPGSVVGHSVRWQIPTCAGCATGHAAPQGEPASFAEIFVYGVMIAWVVVVIALCALVIGASDWLQLIWLVPVAILLFPAMMLPAALLADFAAGKWDERRGRQPVGLKVSDSRPCVRFVIEKVERLPGSMQVGEQPWGPHVYRFTFQRRDYAERFSAMNGGICVTDDSAGQSELKEMFSGPPIGPSIRAFGGAFQTAWAICFAIILAVAIILALFGAFRFGDVFSMRGLGIVALISGCLAFGFTLGPDKA
jgi:membrane protein implicated in regulation of membrane protease activity